MKNYAILVNSCDAYSDLWPSFFYLLRENWNGVEKHNIYINTESRESFDCDVKVKLLNTEQDGPDQWGKRLIHSLSRIEEDYVVVLMDDFYLKNTVLVDELDNCVKAFEENKDIAAFYLVSTKKKEMPESEFRGFAEIPKKTNYRLNSAPAIWRKDKLMAYTEDTDNPWAWEYFGTCRTNHTKDRFFTVADPKKPVYDYAHAIYRGKWLEKDMNPLLEKYQLSIDTSVRGIVKEREAVPKRDLKWKINFIKTGIKMVGIEALAEIFRDIRDA